MHRLTNDWRVMAVQDVYRVMPWSDAMYGCDSRWWDIHGYCGGYIGHKYSTHDEANNKKLEAAEKHDLQIVRGAHGSTFSRDPELIHYGSNSGFQAVNLALLLGCPYIALVGFDMKLTGGKAHFFGDHPKGLHNNKDYGRFTREFDIAAKKLEGVRIVNATPGSALKCFEQMELADALNGGVYRDGAIADAGADRGCAA